MARANGTRATPTESLEAPKLHVMLAPAAQSLETRSMKPTSTLLRSRSTGSNIMKYIRKSSILATGLITLLAMAGACGDPPVIRNNGSAGAGGNGSGGGNEAGAGGNGTPNDPLPLRVANWNVHNLENDKDDSGAQGETIVTPAEYAAHRKAVGKVLNQIDADILVLVEVENKAVLDDLNQTELGGKYSASSLIDGNDYRGVDIGVLSKYPIDSVVSHKDEGFPLNGTQGPNYYYSRDCPEIHIRFNGRNMVFLGTHLKAKSNDDPIKRLAEAQHTRAIADSLAKQDPTRAIAILGDFNDTPDSPPYVAIVGSGASKYTDATLSIAAADRWSYNFQGKLELIDYQFVNTILAPMLDAQSVTIKHSADVDTASDHSPVIATYMVN